MKQWIYDLETYPNFFCATFLDFNSDEHIVFRIDDQKQEQQELVEFIKKEKSVLVGYNNSGFDDPILCHILNKKNCTAKELFDIAQVIVQGGRQDASDELKRKRRSYIKKAWYQTQFISIDLMTLHASRKLRVSLKEMEVSLQWPKVQDLPYPFDEDLTESQKEEVIDYNLNDCGATKELCNRLAEDINLRINIESQYGVKCLSKDGVRTGVDIFAKLYENEVKDNSFLDKKTFRPVINLGECISDVVKFNSKQFNYLLDTLKKKTITKTKDALKYHVVYGGVRHDYGTGGLHSKDKPGIYEPREGEIYMDADVNSLYPSIIIEYGFCPAHLDADTFLPLYKALRDERLEAKQNAKNDPQAALIADTYKLSLNGTFGNLINKYSWLYDPKAAMSVTLNGQLMLSMLSERFTDAKFRVDSINTDGITCFVPEDKIDLYYQICKEWEEETKLSLEFTRYYKVFRTAVNDYLAWYADKDGQPLYDEQGQAIVKEKGDFIRDIRLGKGYDKPVVSIALYDYFIKNIPLEKTIQEHTNIYDFCMMQKMGISKATGTRFQALYNGELLQKTNRFYACKNAPYLYKTDGISRSHVLKDSGVMIFNDYEDKEFKDYNINYDYYIREARKIQRQVEPEQLSLF